MSRLAADVRRRSLGRTLTGFAAIAIAAVLLYWSLRGVDWKRVWGILASAKPLAAASCYVLSSTALFLRACRWRVLLRAGAPIDLSLAFWATAAGYFGNNFLPARAGELVRTFMIAARSPLTRAYVLTTALSERAADAITLALVAGAALLVLPQKPAWLIKPAWAFAAVGLAGLLGIVVLPQLAPWTIRKLVTSRLAPKRSALLQRLIAHIAFGLRALHNRKRLASFALLTVAIWCVDASAVVSIGRALSLNIPLPLAFLLIAALGLGSALPSAPGYVGIYQFVAVSVLTPFGFTRSSAIAVIILAQGMSYAVIGFWGAIGFFRYRVKVDATRTSGE